MKSFSISTILAGAAHLISIPTGLILLIFPIILSTEIISDDKGFTQSIQSYQTLLESNFSLSLPIIVFPWIISGVCLISNLMVTQNTSNNSIRLRWKTYTWGAVLLMGIYIFLSPTGLYYNPVGLLLLLSIIIKR